MNDTNTTDTRQPVQGSGIATGYDLKTRRERPGGDDTAVQFGMVCGVHRITPGILHDYCQAGTAPVPVRRHRGHQTQTARTCAGHGSSPSDSGPTESTSVQRTHMEFTPVVVGAVGSWGNPQPTLCSQIPSSDERSLHSFLPHSQTQTGLCEGGAVAQQSGKAQKKCARGKLTLAFVDECGFSPSQPVNYSWAATGERKYVPYENPNRRRMNVMAAMMSDGCSESVVWSRQPRPFKSEEFVKFLMCTFSDIGGLKVVVLDNYSIHRSKVVKEACGRLRREGIVLYYLPAYSPELNDIEGVFGAIKHHDMPERSYRSLDELGEAIDSAFTRADRRLKSVYEHQLRPGA